MRFFTSAPWNQNLVKVAAPFLALLVLAHLPGTASATYETTGMGTNAETGTASQSGQATFTISGDSLIIVLTNTTAGGTSDQGNALTGLEFNVNGANPTLGSGVPPIVLTSGSHIITNSSGTIDDSTALGNSWTHVLSSKPSPAGFNYGIATTGFNGEFNGSTISPGNASPNYGLVATGTNFSTFGGSRYPFIENSLTFKFTGFSGVSESQIKDVSFLFGTAGTGRIAGGTPTVVPNGGVVPAPSSVILLGIGCLGLFGFTAVRRFRRAPVAA